MTERRSACLFAHRSRIWIALAVLAAGGAMASGVSLAQDVPIQEYRGRAGQPLVIEMPMPAAPAGIGVVVLRSQLLAAPPGAAPVVENGEQKVTVTGAVPGLYRLRLTAVSVQQATCSSSEETVLETREAVLSLAP